MKRREKNICDGVPFGRFRSSAILNTAGTPVQDFGRFHGVSVEDLGCPQGALFGSKNRK